MPCAGRRTRDRVNRFTGLYEQIVNNRLSRPSIDEIAWRDTIFQEIDYRVYAVWTQR